MYRTPGNKNRSVEEIFDLSQHSSVVSLLEYIKTPHHILTISPMTRNPFGPSVFSSEYRLQRVLSFGKESVNNINLTKKSSQCHIKNVAITINPCHNKTFEDLLFH